MSQLSTQANSLLLHLEHESLSMGEQYLRVLMLETEGHLRYSQVLDGGLDQLLISHS